MNFYKKVMLLIFSLIVKPAFSQYTETINSNRPGVSRGAFAVGINVAQVEVGPYMVKEEHAILEHDVSGFGADFAIRYGFMLEELELNIEGAYQNDTKTFRKNFILDEKRSNFRFLTVGAKYLLYDPYKNPKEVKPNFLSWKKKKKFNWRQLIPAVAIYAGANYDSNPNPYTATDIEGFSPKVMITAQNNFPGGLVVVFNLTKDRIGKEQSDLHYILTLTRALNQKWAVFGEYQGIYSDFYADNLFRVGGAFLWSKDFQLDTAVTLNAKNTPTVLSVDLGFSYRFDFHRDKINNGTSVKDTGKRRSSGRGKNKSQNTSQPQKGKKRQTDF